MSTIQRLVQSKFKEAAYLRSTFLAQPEYGLTLKDVLKPEYWAHVAFNLKAGARIEVQPEGLTWGAELIVIDAGPNWAKVKVWHFVDLVGTQTVPDQAPIKTEVDAGLYLVERAGAWFRVVRKSDKEVMKTGFREMIDAEKWAADNLKTVA